MSIATELTLLANSKQAIKNSINQKGGSITDSTPFADYSTAIDNLPSGGDDSTLIDLIERDITSITIPSGTTNIGDSAFKNCIWLTGSITIPNSVTTISNDAFFGCSRLTSITIPNTVTSIGSNAFYGTGLTSITIPNTVTSIGNGLFGYCPYLTSVSLPNSLTSIPQDTFQVSGLTSFTFPSSITNIGQNAFKQTQLTTITIPNTVTSINSYAFRYCSHLTSIICLASTPPTLGSNVFDSTNDCPIYVPSESVDTYKAANRWSLYASRIQAIPEE